MPRRRAISNKRKLDIIADAKQINELKYLSKQNSLNIKSDSDGCAKGRSMRSLAKEYDVVPKQLRVWMKNEQMIRTAKPDAKSINKGRPSCIQYKR